MIYLVLMPILGLLYYLFFILPTQWLKLEKIKHDMGLHTKILQISDIHIKNLRVKPEKIMKIIEREKPNYIFITGDIVERHEYEVKLVKDFLSIILKKQVETYAVLGNHDRYLPDTQKLEELLKSFNIKLLKNECIEKDTFYIIGVDDCSNGNEDVDLAFSEVRKDKKRIVITHNPELVIKKKMKPFDYLMAGHFHGRQINIPFLFQDKSTNKLMGNGIFKGKHKVEKGTIYISKGISQTKLNIRLFVRSEITLHEL